MHVHPSPGLTCYEVLSHTQNGHSFFSTRGGMSAEVCVAKCLASLIGTESSSWLPSERGRGPEPVSISDDFLFRSIEKTKDVYLHNREKFIGNVEVAILGPGSMAVPYLCHHLNAIYLPTQFLVSFKRMAGLRALLAKAAQQHLAAYAVAGIDDSIPDTGVAWLKLMGLPEVYRALLTICKIKTVIFVDNNQPSGGEGLFRKLFPKGTDFKGQKISFGPEGEGEPYRQDDVKAQDIFLHFLEHGKAKPRTYVSFNKDFDQLKPPCIEDLYECGNDLDPTFRRGDDWESGMTKQIPSLAGDVKNIQVFPSIEVYKLEANDSLDLFHLALHLSLEKYLKNGRTQLGNIALNPYYVCNPLYEEKMGHLPYCFWQGLFPDVIVPNLLKQLDLAQKIAGKRADIGAVREIWFKVTANFQNDKWKRDDFAKVLPDHLKLNSAPDLSGELERWGASPSGWAKWINELFHTYHESNSPEQLRQFKASQKSLTIEDIGSLMSRLNGLSGKILFKFVRMA